jgi:integrase
MVRIGSEASERFGLACEAVSVERLGQRYRRPYCARHSSVSWNLMIGKNPLFVARQHGHSLVTMWRTYAAWMDGAFESDIDLIRAAIEVPPLNSLRVLRNRTAPRRWD